MKQKKLHKSADPMNLDADVVEAYRINLIDPKANGLTFDPLAEYFDKSETVTSRQVLAKQYTDYINVNIPKVILRVVMDDLFKKYKCRDKNGNNGFYLKFNR